MEKVKFTRTLNILKRLPKAILSVSRSEVYNTANALKNELQASSPVDEGTFQSNWWVARGKKSGNIVASSSVQNRMVYGPPIEYGSSKGQKPWPTARTPKTVEVGGKIYSTQAVGGIFKKVGLQRFADNLARNINSGIMANIQ